MTFLCSTVGVTRVSWWFCRRFRRSVCITLLLLCVPALTDGPRFIEPIPNVTVALGRDASLPCVVENLGSYKVSAS